MTWPVFEMLKRRKKKEYIINRLGRVRSKIDGGTTKVHE
jgi:hypothetical protein